MDDGTTPELVDPMDVRLKRFYERHVEAENERKKTELENEFKHLSNLKKDIVRRKIRKLIRRNQREIKRNT